uniref:Secreted protein n=1 Tax=Mesocestoides corti TaxID=53468 RepID=A0A5K3FV67_MESCO
MFGTNICRSVPFTAKMWVPTVNFPKLKLLVLELDDAAFESADGRPENAGFHNQSYPGDRYPPSGLWSLGPCILPSVSGNKPLYVSLPYFNKAADEVRDAIIFEDGIEPGAISQLKVDPKTGFIIEGTLQYQVNLLVPKSQYGAANDTMYPLALIQEFKAASREDAENLYNTAYAFPQMIRMVVRVLFSILTVLAFSLLLATVIRKYLDYRAAKEIDEDKVTAVEFNEDDSISDKSMNI